MYNLYTIDYMTKSGERISTEYSCDNEVEAALWFAYEFADELNGETIAPEQLDIEHIGYTFYGKNEVYDYRGHVDPYDTFCEIKWSYVDLMFLMAKKNIPVTDENIDKIVKCRLEKTMQDRSTEEGWEILDCIIDGAID